MGIEADHGDGIRFGVNVLQGGLLLSGRLTGLAGNVGQSADEADALRVGDDLQVAGDEIVNEYLGAGGFDSVAAGD